MARSALTEMLLGKMTPENQDELKHGAFRLRLSLVLESLRFWNVLESLNRPLTSHNLPRCENGVGHKYKYQICLRLICSPQSLRNFDL